MFDDGRLEDAAALAGAERMLRPLAEAGARLRRAVGDSGEALVGIDPERPRAVIAVGPEGRLLRAVLEPVCPVPFVAWPIRGLPGWVGPLDLVVVLGADGPHPYDAVAEALRRGSRVIIVGEPHGVMAQRAASRLTTVLPAASTDPFVRAVIGLLALSRLGLGIEVDPDAVAAAQDNVAIGCGHGVDIAHNPAKELALSLGDAEPLVWGTSMLASRASRRIAEALREASGRVALAADASELIPLLAATRPRDLFEDPFDEAGTPMRPSLLILDDGLGDDESDREADILTHNADAGDVRTSVIAETSGAQLVRYASILQRGRFAAAYLALGLGRTITW